MRNFRLQHVVIAIILVFSMMFLLPACFAQQDVAGMTGQVTDKSGAAVTGAEVTLRNPSKGFKLIELTNNIGFYRFVQIPPGDGYEATFKAKGFNPLEIKNIYLTVATVRTQNASMEVGARTDVVQVSASNSEVTIDTTTASIGNTFDVDQLNSLPVQQRNDPIALFKLQPGVNDSGSVTGARVDQNSITVDGLDATDFATGGAMTSNSGLGVTTPFGSTAGGTSVGNNLIVGHAPIDSVEELHVTVGGNEASAGPGGGGQFALVTKSGTNKFHGNLNEYHRDPLLAANSWFNKNASPVVPRNHLIQNQFGGNIGGPIIKDKLFFFFDYNNSKVIRSEDVQRTVPLDTFRGDYPGGAELGYINSTGGTSYLSPSQVASFDPSGYGENSTWVGTATCPSSPSLVSYTCRFPHSNNMVTGDGVNSGGFLFNAPDNDYETNYIGRGDWNINDNMKMFARFTIVRENAIQNPNEFAGDPPSNPFIDRTYAFVIGHTWVIGSDKTNRVVLGETVQKYAFPNTYNPDGSTFYVFSDGTGPAMASSLYLQPGGNFRRIPIPVVGDDFSWTKGTHTWQFGGTFKDILAHDTSENDYNTIEIGMGGYVSSLCGGGGTTCGSNPSMRPNDINNTTEADEADYDYDNAFGFITGRIANDASDFNYNSKGVPLNQLSGDQRMYRYYQTQLYAQDTWKITPSITASYGLNWQKFSVPYETRGLESTEPYTADQYMSARETQSALGQTGAFAVPLIPYVLGGQANNGPPLYSPEWRNLAPHVGFNYNPGFDKKMVINAGAGIVYDRTVVNAVQLQQDIDSYLFQLTLPISMGISGDAYNTFKDYDHPYTYGTLGPRIDSNNSISQIQPYIVPPPTPSAPYEPFNNNSVCAGNPLPCGLVLGYAFNSTIDPSLKTPYNITFNFGLQRTLPWDLVLKASYDGRLGRRLLAQADVNQVLDFPDSASGQMLSAAWSSLTQQLRANPSIDPNNIIPQPWFENVLQPGIGVSKGYANNSAYVVGAYTGNVFRGDFGDIVEYLSPYLPLNVGSAAQFSENTFYTNKGFSSYHALLFTLQKNMAHGLRFDLNYTFSHSIDNISLFASGQGDTGIGGLGLVCDIVRPRECRGNSDFDIKQTFTGDATYILPFGKGKTFLNDIPHWEDEIVGGWELSGIATGHSGQAWGTVSNAFVSSFSNDAPGILVGPKSAVATHLVKNGPAGPANLFANQSNAENAYVGPIGFHIGARNSLRGPRFFNNDIGLGKTFNVYRRLNLQFRADAFNVFNHPNFSLPGNNVYNGLDQQDVTSSTFGDVSYTVEPGGNLNNGARVMQVSLRLEF